jgi:spore maturation protein SpmA
MLLNLIWLAFFVSAFAVALARLAMGDLEVFPSAAGGDVRFGAHGL